MLITRIELENIKSYREVSIDFRQGTTAISGANGAGKTTIVEAIGFALFGFLPYNQTQFVREGEKYGQVVVHLLGNDDRPYAVERRCGSGAHWFVYDREADSRVEQRTDVLDKLHDLFGIDRERSLETLFQDALGVPQGTFTSIFLQTPGVRKSTFDALLQIEDYKIAADYLLDAQKQYKEQIITQEKEIARLEFETRDLQAWHGRLKEERQLDQQQTSQISEWTRRLRQAEARSAFLKQQHEELIQLEGHFQHSKQAYEGTQQRLQDSLRELQAAREAQQAVEACREDYQRYLQADTALKSLRQDERQRSSLRESYALQHTQLTEISTNVAHIQARLGEVAEARRLVVELSSLVEQQVELEKQRDELKRRFTQYEGIVEEGKRLVQQHATYLHQQQERTLRISAIEPLQPAAALLNERVEALVQLQERLKERAGLQMQLHEKQDQLRAKQEEREKFSARIRKAESAIAKIEEHRLEAQELPALQLQHEQIIEQRYRLEGNIEGYIRSREQSTGGQCPFLHETCLNIKQRGLISLESYFDGMLAKDRRRLADIIQQQASLAARMAFVKKYTDALDKLGQYSEERANNAEHLQHLAIEIVRFEREIHQLEQDVETLRSIDQQIKRAEALRNESRQADEQVRQLAGLRMQVQQLQEQAASSELVIQERRQQARELRGSEEQLQQVEQQLLHLNDPRAQTRAQNEKIKREPEYLQHLQAEQQKQQATAHQLQILEQKLQVYAALDSSIGEQEAALQQALSGYQTYLANTKTAQLLPQRQQMHQGLAHTCERQQQVLQMAEQAYQQAKNAFQQQELDDVSAETRKLHGGLEGLGEAIRNTQKKIYELEQQIQHAEALLLELEAAQKEKLTLDELQTMMDQFRKYMKEAGPHVLKAMLSDISAEANRIFGEIMGDRTAQLSWQNDYEIVLRRQGLNRSFAQLSGGEQMSAALAMRLALLKKLSTLNIAFFDEPTQNMDELRRMNLAEQIRRVRGFDQLIIISHDDTFEQGLDSLVRLRKVDGETRLMSEDELMARAL